MPDCPVITFTVTPSPDGQGVTVDCSEDLDRIAERCRSGIATPVEAGALTVWVGFVLEVRRREGDTPHLYRDAH